MTAAAFLRRRGHAPTLVVAPTRPAGNREALVLWSGAVALLADLGIEAVGEVLADGSAVRTWRSRDAGGGRRVERAPDADTPLLVVDRPRIREALRDGLPSASLRISKTPTAVDPSPDGPVVAFADGVRERFDAVIGADGRRSWVRRTALGGGPRRPPATATWSFRMPAPVRPSTLLDAWGDGRGLLLGPEARGRLVLAPDAADPSPMGALRRDGLSLSGRFDPDTVDDLVRLDGRVGWASRWSHDGVALLGDAAHAFHPALSLGGSLAVADAAALGAALETAPPSTALRRYERRRRERIAALARRVAAGNGVRTVPFPVEDVPDVRSVRRALLGGTFGPGRGPLGAAVRTRP